MNLKNLLRVLKSCLENHIRFPMVSIRTFKGSYWEPLRVLPSTGQRKNPFWHPFFLECIGLVDSIRSVPSTSVTCVSSCFGLMFDHWKTRPRLWSGSHFNKISILIWYFLFYYFYDQMDFPPSRQIIIQKVQWFRLLF